MYYKVWSSAVVFSFAFSGIALANTNDENMLELVRERGYLICGVGDSNPGFIKHDKKIDEGRDYFDKLGSVFSGSTGLEADLCRAIAIATFGANYSESNVGFKQLSLDSRFTALRDGEVDVVLYSTTWTSFRDAAKGVDFGPVYFHDSQKFLVRSDNQPSLSQLYDLKEKTICVRGNTTTLENLRSVSNQFDLDWRFKSGDEFDTFQALYTALVKDNPDCDAVAGDESSLLILKTQADRPKPNIIPEQPLSYEPLAAMVAENNSLWLDIVSYAIWSTIWAEQEGIKKSNAREFAADTWMELVGDEKIGEMIIAALGNYGEIFDKHLGEFINNDQRGRNLPRKLLEDGWMIPPPMESSTIEISRPIQTEFKSNRSIVTPKIENDILNFFNELRREFKGNKIVSIEVSGHTDRVGNADWNLTLSENRATAVAEYIKKLYPNIEIDTRWFGETVPLEPDSNDTKQGREANRRVEIAVRLK